MVGMRQIFKCEDCGNIVGVMHTGVGELVCCGKPMVLMTEKTVDAGKEKHVPVVEKTPTGIKVKIGSVEHPMEENHYIEWIEVFVGPKTYRKYLHAGEKPEAEFTLSADKLEVREYCNVHGLWKVNFP